MKPAARLPAGTLIIPVSTTLKSSAFIASFLTKISARELIIFYNETLKVLVDYDHDRDSELVHTLSLYFKCGGNLKRLAEEMGVHYNTVAYRIQRIKELAHVSFDNADQMLNLQIALKIYEVNFHR